MHYRILISIFKENFITEMGFFFTWSETGRIRILMPNFDTQTRLQCCMPLFLLTHNLNIYL